MMSVREDRDEFENAGLNGLVKKLLTSSREAFVCILSDGWQGEEVKERPCPGTGPYLYIRPGEPVLRYSNATPADAEVQEYRLL